MILQRQIWLRYGSAAVAAGLAFVLSFSLHRYFGGRTFAVIYVPAVTYAAFVGGRGPAIFATFLCLCSSAFFLGENLYTNPANLIDVAFFAALGPILGVIGNRLLRESEGARNRQAQLQSILDAVPEAIGRLRR